MGKNSAKSIILDKSNWHNIIFENYPIESDIKLEIFSIIYKISKGLVKSFFYLESFIDCFEKLKRTMGEMDSLVFEYVKEEEQYLQFGD